MTDRPSDPHGPLTEIRDEDLSWVLDTDPSLWGARLWQRFQYEQERREAAQKRERRKSA